MYDNPTNKGALAGNHYRFGGNYEPGTTPTLLESREAQKVVRFIENFIYKSEVFLNIGSPNRNGFWFDFTDPTRVGFWLQVQTDLIFDKSPELGGDLILNGFNIIANKANSFFRQFENSGLSIISGTGTGYTGTIRLGSDPINGFPNFVGFKAPTTVPSGVIWTLPATDGTANQVLKTNGSAVLSWGTASGAVVLPSNTINVTVSGSNYTPHIRGLELETLTGRKGQFIRVKEDETGFEFTSCPLCVMGACCVEGVCTQTTEIDCPDVWLEGVLCSPGLCAEGTCCDEVGDCTFVIESLCPEGTWNEGGTCSPNPCAQPPTGSCCAPDGTCTVTTQAACAHTWTQGATCSPNPCDQPTGSCCAPDGTCSLTQEWNCAYTWTMFGVCTPNPCPQPPATGSCCAWDGSCTETTQANCGLGSSWTQGGTCSPNTCVPSGACCVQPSENAPDGCVLLTEAACAAYAGPGNGYSTWQGAGVLCASVQCGPCCGAAIGAPELATNNTEAQCAAMGGDWYSNSLTSGYPVNQMCYACCCPGQSCVNLPEVNCEAINPSNCISYFPVSGLFERPAYVCTETFCDTGSCCQPDGSCSAGGIEIDCETGTFFPGGNCSPNVCAQPTGSCCAPDGTCTVTTQAACAHTWTQGATCSPNPCAQPPTGSCCNPDGSCTVTTEAACIYTWTNGGVCTPNTCEQPPPTGSCCAPDNTCTETIQSNCAFTWTQGQTCSPNPCGPAPTGACCDPYRNCTMHTQSNCESMGHAWLPNATCATSPCAALPDGSCCYFDNSCSVTLEAPCLHAQGTWTQGGTCSPNICAEPPLVGRCCAPDGSCTDTTAANCPMPPSTWNWPGTCAANPCVPAPTGSCCAPDGTCVETTQANCPAPSTWTQGGTCSPNTCEQWIPGSCCAVDGSCTVTSQVNCPAPSTWTLGGNCSPNICNQIVMGSCCDGNLNCSQTTYTICQAILQGEGWDGEVSWVAGQACGENTCEAWRGACCTTILGNPACIEVSAVRCAINPNSDFLGNGTTCAGVICD